MYNFIKTIIASVLPLNFLKKYDSFFRKLITVFYLGKNHNCNVCNTNLNRFITLPNNDLLCPNCGSRSRTRRLFELLQKDESLTGKVLHFSPPKSLFKKFKALDIHYFSSDFENEFIADYNYDITAIPVSNNYFDTIICYHILEHIEDDEKAINELFRVLKPNGICYIQTPFKDGDTYEDNSIKTPEERTLAFGQEDHVRIYSAKDLDERLKRSGFKTKIHQFKKENFHGFNKETVIYAKK